MNRADTTEGLRAGACMDLPPAVVDKYFGAGSVAEPFEYRTAQAICRHCVAQVECLVDAISSTAPFDESNELMRGGQSARAIRIMRHEHFAAGVPAADLAAAGLRRLAATRRLDRNRRFRQGRFPDTVPVLPTEADGR
ncbi:MAG TPA: hypothetical protein VHO01_07955 [Jatrophihabitans sp.]|nr:hypothetical protein [Jatrophihabitans sp.]